MNSLDRQRQLQKSKQSNDQSRYTSDKGHITRLTRSQQALSKETLFGGSALSIIPEIYANIPWGDIPIASTTVLGAIKVGANLTIDVNGVLNASGGAGATNWGLIGGDIGDQGDLVAALLLKADVSHTLEGHTATVTDGKFLKGTGVNTFAWEDHGLTYTDVNAIGKSSSASKDREILTWNGIGGNSVRVDVGVKIDSAYAVVADGDVVAYQSGSYTGSVWDGLPVDNVTLQYASGILRIKPSIAGNNLKVLRVDAAGTGVEWGTASAPMVYPGAGIALSTGSAWGSSITNNSANWNTAYGWGNHASAGYAPIANPTFTGTATAPVFKSSNWYRIAGTTDSLLGYMGSYNTIVGSGPDTACVYIASGNSFAFMNGNVGFGINAPTSKIHIEGAGTLASVFQLDLSDGTRHLKFGVNSTTTELQSTGGVPLYLNYGGNSIYMFGNTAARLYINGGLHVGGTSDPGDNNILTDGEIRSVGDVVAYYS